MVGYTRRWRMLTSAARLTGKSSVDLIDTSSRLCRHLLGVVIGHSRGNVNANQSYGQRSKQSARSVREPPHPSAADGAHRFVPCV